MADSANEMGVVGLDIEAPGISRGPIQMPNLPKPLTLEEKKYLLAVERGDMANVRRMLQLAPRRHHINVNCLDPLGRGALTLAIDGENLEMVELLVVMGVETRDALLHAINAEFVEAVELLLEHEELIHKEGEQYSWQKVDWNTGTFTPDITPLVLAAHKNNYEIIKILLDRGATLPMPHDVKCGCDECLRESQEDSLRFSQSRVNEYRALASPSLIALSSNDPILTAFQLSWALRNLAFAEQECKADYMELRRQCQQFAVDLLHQSRSSQELAIILNHDPDSPPYEQGEHMKLARLELAINYKQKKFVAHPNIQQLLAAIWYEGVPGFRRKPVLKKCIEISRVALLFPFYCMLYMVAPNTPTGKLMRKPFMKFLIHASSYLFFLLILILVSQRAEVQVIQLLGTESMRKALEEQLLKQRGQGPSPLEWVVLVYVLGFIWEETHEIYLEGIQSYLRNMWNFIDFTRNSLYTGVAVLRIAAYIQQSSEIARDPGTAYIPRERWNDFDPQLIAEGLFAGANIFSALKLVHLFSINPHLGPLQISLGRMVIDIVKFFFIYSLVLFAFACGLNQLLWYFAELERRKCYCLPGGLPDWDNHGDSCMKWRSFGNLFESSQSLFWASFGGIGIDSFELAGIKTYTRFWGLLMFGSYSVINVIVLLNLLIAMMSNSYAMIDEHSDTEWKFARTRLWMSYFEESATLPPPFNIFPTPKLIVKLLGLRKKDKLRRMSSKRKERHEKERDYRYTAVMRALVWRYVTAMHRQAEENLVTEDDISEVKGEISAMKCQVMEVLSRNGMDVSSADTEEKNIMGKKMRVWERRLMKDFHVAPVAAEEEMDQLLNEPPPPDEDALSRFRRVARLAVMNSSSNKWDQVVRGVCLASQIGRCNNRESYKNQQNLQKAMDEARILVAKSPIPGATPPISLPNTGSTILELLQNIKEEVDDEKKRKPRGGGTSGGEQQSVVVSSNLQVQSSSQGPLMTNIKMQAQPAPHKGAPNYRGMTDSKLLKSAAPKATPRPNVTQLGDADDQKTKQSTPVADKPAQTAPGEKTLPSPATGVQLAPVAVTGVHTSPARARATGENISRSPATCAKPAPVAVSGERTAPVAVTGETRSRSPATGAKPTPVAVSGERTAPIAVTGETRSRSPATGAKPAPVHAPTITATQATNTTDPSPLIPQRKVNGGDTPPKVIKRKAPTAGHPSSGEIPATCVGEVTEEPNVSRSNVVQPMTLQTNADQQAMQQEGAHASAGTTSPRNHKESMEQGQSPPHLVQPRAAPKELKVQPEVRKPAPSMPQFEVTLANTANSSNMEFVGGGSTEQLIGSRSPSPAPLRPGKRIEDVNTIKRQPKGGWL